MKKPKCKECGDSKYIVRYVSDYSKLPDHPPRTLRAPCPHCPPDPKPTKPERRLTQFKMKPPKDIQ